MVLGLCSCEHGKDANTNICSAWVSGKANGINFVPVTSAILRQKLAWVALGASLSLNHYTTLRCNVDDCEITNTTSMPGKPTKHTHEILEEIPLQLDEISQMSAGDDAAGSSNQVTRRKAINSLQQSCNILVEKLESCQDQTHAVGIIKFSERLNLLSGSMQGNLISALFTFGVNQLSKEKNGKKIKVQRNRK